MIVAGGLHYVTVTLMTIYQQSNDRQIEVESKSIRSYNHRIAHSRCYYVTTSSVIDDLLLVKAVIATTIRLRFDRATSTRPPTARPYAYLFARAAALRPK